MGSYRFVSLFAGAGGLDLGLEMAGWDCVYASDHDPEAIATLRSNAGKFLPRLGVTPYADTIIEESDIQEISGHSILQKCGLHVGDVDLVAGGPPCQSWSSAGSQGGLRDPRGRLFEEFVRIAEEMEPKWLLFENVRGLVTARGPDGKPGSALQLIRKRLLDAGFHTTLKLLNAADYGAGQRRVRLFLIGYRDGIDPPFPAPTHSKAPDLAEPGKLPWVTLWDTLAHLPRPHADEIIRPSDKLYEQLKELTPGTGVKSPGKKETTRPGGHWGYKQGAFLAALDLPARTVTASSQQDWIKDPFLGVRRLTPSECAAIQSFPKQWRFCAKRKSSQYRLIGNAVPPKLAREIGATLLEHAKKSELQTGFPFSSLDKLTPLPDELSKAIEYTLKEERRNGPSRKLEPPKKKMRAIYTTEKL